ncbi:MAG TPA: protein kinase, partial [Polyangiaceae bacterium LLY-WYZ-15_(1-7)]|nr:protein kinase [Polyangiaceae bacterium LLY-WYZ-15_(1-7)]
MGSPATNDLQRNLAGRQLGRYEVLTQLASGGMAAVYVARAKGVAGFERLVAIKVLHPHLAYEEEFISMFLDEARLAARIRHPNVVPTLDISDTEGDGFFLVMEYIEGDHLGALLG